ncbi:MAG: hypothetical protein WDO06_07665 [Actinomycetota bacterium]
MQLTKYGLTIVGYGTLKNTYLFSGTFATGRGIPLLLANGTQALSQLDKLSTLQEPMDGLAHSTATRSLLWE